MGDGFFSIIGMKPDFNYRGSDRSSSSCGNFVGIFVFLFIFWAFYQVGNDIFFHENPIVVSSKIFMEDPGQILIDPSEFYFALGLERPDNFAHYIDSGIYNVKAVHYNMKRVRDSAGNINLVETNTELELEVCTLDHFGDKASMFSNLEYKSLFCLKKNQPNMDKVIIKGKFEVDEVSFLRFAFLACNNATSNQTCKTQEELDFLLSGAYFAVYYTDVAIDPKNYSQPERIYMDAKFTTFGKTYFKEYQIWISHNEITTDSGWLMEDSSVRYSNSFDSLKEFLDLRSAGDQFVEFQVRVSPFYNYYSRQYIKIQDILANVDGLLTLVLVSIAIAILPYVKMKFYEGLIAEVFDVNTSLDYFQHGPPPKYVSPPKLDHGKTDNYMHLKHKAPKNSPIKVDIPDKPKLKIHKPSSDTASNSPKNIPKLNEDDSPLVQPIPTTLRKQDKSNMYTAKPEKQTFSDRRPNFKVISEQEIDASCSIDIHDQEPKTDIGMHRDIPEPKTDIGMNNAPNVPEIKVSEAPSLQDDFLELPTKPRKFDFKKENSSEILQDYGDLDEHKFIYKSLANIQDNLKSGLDMSKALPTPDDRIKRKISRVKKVVEPGQVKNPDLNISAIEYFRSFFSQEKELKKKFKIVKEGQRRIEERLDVFNILKKFREIDKLKALLLDKEQLILFDYLPKPVLDYSELMKNFSDSVSVLRDPEFIKIREAVFQDAYQNLYRRPHKSGIDKKLIDIYDGLV